MSPLFFACKIGLTVPIAVLSMSKVLLYSGGTDSWLIDKLWKPDKKIYINFYGKHIVDWNFINGEMTIRETNLADDPTTNMAVNFMEMTISYDETNNTLNIVRNNQLNLRGGVTNAVNPDAYIYKITGKRTRF